MPKSPELPPDPSPPTSTQAAERSLAPRKRSRAAGANAKKMVEGDKEPAEGDPFVEFFKERAQAAGPGVALSLAFHLVLLVVLGLVVIKNERPKSIPTTLSGFDASGLDRPGHPRSIVPVQIDAAKGKGAQLQA